DSAPGFRRQLGGGLGEHLLAAAADDELGAELEEAMAHAVAEASAAASDEDALVVEQVRLEHRPTITERGGPATAREVLPHQAAYAYSCVSRSGKNAVPYDSAKRPYGSKNNFSVSNASRYHIRFDSSQRPAGGDNFHRNLP